MATFQNVSADRHCLGFAGGVNTTAGFLCFGPFEPDELIEYIEIFAAPIPHIAAPGSDNVISVDLRGSPRFLIPTELAVAQACPSPYGENPVNLPQVIVERGFLRLPCRWKASQQQRYLCVMMQNSVGEASKGSVSLFLGDGDADDNGQ